MSKIILKNDPNTTKAVSDPKKKLNKRDSLSTKIAKFKKTDIKSKKKYTKKIKNLIEIMNNTNLSNTDKFMCGTCKNIVLFNDQNQSYMNITGRVSKKNFSKLSNKLSATHILISSGQSTYHKIPYKLYKELSKIKFMTLKFNVDLLEDGEEEYDNVFSHTYTIQHMNFLFGLLNKLSGLREFMKLYHVSIGWYSVTEITETIKILYKNNTYKETTFSDFLRTYGLNIYL